MKRGTTTNILIETKDGYFVAELDNGQIRVGLKDAGCIDYPSYHHMYNVAANLDETDVEAFFDDQVAPALLTTKST